MKKYFGLFISGLAFFVLSAKSQSLDEAIRLSWLTPNGTARNMAVGGVMGSLGGDITANHVNPAGIGLYKTRELVLSPGLVMNNNKFNYRGSDTSSKRSGFGIGTSGLVLAGTNKNGYSKWTSSAFAISVNQLANYNNQISFSGTNNFSSFTEKYLEELTRDRADTNAALSNYIFGSSLAFRTFLVDTLSGPGGSVAGYQSLVPISSGIKQLNNARTSGGYSEIALGLAGNMADKLYVGGSLTIPIIKYTRELFYSERDATNDPGNQFSFFEFRETYTSQGAGIGLKLGTLYKPSDYVRIGFAFHSPQIISMTDRIRASLIADTEGYAGRRSESSDRLNNGQPGRSKYTITTPWRAIGSFSIVLREVSDTRLQKGFISADLEYVHYKGARFAVASENASNAAFRNYYTALNDAVIDNLKGNINARIGGELKLHTIMFRLGAAYYGSPYQDEALQASRVIGSGGIGYRNKGMFIDLSYSHIMNKEAEFAYRLNDKPNTFANQSGNRGNIMLTFGFKF